MVCLDPLPSLYYHGSLAPPPREAPPSGGLRNAVILSEVMRGRFEPRSVDPRWPISTHDHFVPFKSVSFRSPADAVREETVGQIHADIIRNQPRFPTSTLESLDVLLEDHWLSASVSCLAELILRILYEDISVLSEVIRASLENLRSRIVDISIPELQRQSLQWRSTLGRSHFEMQKLIDDLPRFVNFMHRDDGGVIVLPGPAKHMNDAIVAQLKETNEHVDRAFTVLPTELQIADTRKSIEEAESVAKLTELAFVFIPLTFAAGVFSVMTFPRENPSERDSSYGLFLSRPVNSWGAWPVGSSMFCRILASRSS